jgi:hypothetical protein
VNGDLTEVVGSHGRQRYDASGQLDPDLAQVVDLRQLRDSMSRS